MKTYEVTISLDIKADDESEAEKKFVAKIAKLAKTGELELDIEEVD